jgi:Transposase DDE domain
LIVDNSNCHSIVVVSSHKENAAISYPHKLRRVAFRDLKTGKRLAVLTNNFDLPALTLAELYRCRWQVELFFKWIKQHLRIKASLYTMLQVLSLTPFEKMPMDKAFFDDDYSEQQPSRFNQLNLLD